MKFRPCIDIHNGKVKQIVGGSLLDEGDFAADNFVSEKDGAYYAALYEEAGLRGGHIILLNPAGSQYYEEDVRQAALALKKTPEILQIGGGMNDENAGYFLDQGASHVIVTSFVFKNGAINEENLKKMVKAVGKKRLVLDLSCRKKGEDYYIVTDRWQKFTSVKLNLTVLEQMSSYCDEFLIHAVDVEGKASGIEKELAKMLGDYDGIPVTYAGDVTIGSALDLFGGDMEFQKVLDWCR
ncbi:MAG: phosphoribosylformimino-5-aminoimidazole carboxamide ribotide isomerase [Lachnospiraceae bacterium]|nr:phosphoribosylformimino-5-aminoimidazole carboxamide ribotide isomerase [Lachnospiraceae bacterium]